MIVQMSVVLNSTVVDSDWSFDNCVVVIFRVKVSCIMSVEGVKILIIDLSGQLSRDTLPLWTSNFNTSTFLINIYRTAAQNSQITALLRQLQQSSIIWKWVQDQVLKK